MLFNVDGIGDSEMTFGEMRPRTLHRLPDMPYGCENLGKNPTRSTTNTSEKDFVVVTNRHTASRTVVEASARSDRGAIPGRARASAGQTRARAITHEVHSKPISDIVKHRSLAGLWCETWTLTLREELRLRCLRIRFLGKIFGAKRDEVTGEWRKLHNAELYALYSSPDIIRNIKSRRLRWAGHIARMGESRNAYRVLVGRSEGKRPLGRPRHR
ncbi:hypothetical protein ANN_06321 [Periplaneta americana]|uniref:Uncharacterized protein n=1 Tax=Periplaneta americana TaxID=6978 RepID=A0ABQ8TFJ1_PERAM|nr:hypothetical protein ANN_06321 [Periplaneta americana]